MKSTTYLYFLIIFLSSSSRLLAETATRPIDLIEVKKWSQIKIDSFIQSIGGCPNNVDSVKQALTGTNKSPEKVDEVKEQIKQKIYELGLCKEVALATDAATKARASLVNFIYTLIP